jgi:hypothetical protein
MMERAKRTSNPLARRADAHAVNRFRGGDD